MKYILLSFLLISCTVKPKEPTEEEKIHALKMQICMENYYYGHSIIDINGTYEFCKEAIKKDSFK